MAKRKSTAFQPGEQDYRDCSFEGERLVLGARGRIGLVRFAATDCEVVVEHGAELLMVDATFRRCEIRSASNKQGTADMARFEECTFHGIFESWVFGGRLEQESLVRCDFRDADLRDCELNRCDVRAQRFGEWPALVFLAPSEHRERILSGQWPKTVKVQIWLQTLLGPTRFPNAGIAVNGEKAARWMRMKPDKLRRIVEELGDVVVRGS